MKRAAIVAAVATGAVLALTAGPPQGKELFDRRCGGCHALNRDKEGPRLGGVYGRAAASGASFSYSEALRRSGLTWDDETLDRWLADSEKLVPETDMPVRVESSADRAAIIAYLKNH